MRFVFFVNFSLNANPERIASSDNRRLFRYRVQMRREKDGFKPGWEGLCLCKQKSRAMMEEK
jgi:hypothetical protein